MHSEACRLSATHKLIESGRHRNGHGIRITVRVLNIRQQKYRYVLYSRMIKAVVEGVGAAILPSPYTLSRLDYLEIPELQWKSILSKEEDEES